MRSLLSDTVLNEAEQHRPDVGDLSMLVQRRIESVQTVQTKIQRVGEFRLETVALEPELDSSCVAAREIVNNNICRSGELIRHAHTRND